MVGKNLVEAGALAVVLVAGGLSLLFWIGVVVAGRWVGFINPSPF